MQDKPRPGPRAAILGIERRGHVSGGDPRFRLEQLLVIAKQLLGKL